MPSILLIVSLLSLGLPTHSEAAGQYFRTADPCIPDFSSDREGVLHAACDDETSRVARMPADVGLVRASTSSDSAQATWSMGVPRDAARVNLRGTATNGVTYLSGGCNRLLGPGLGLTLHEYQGELLQRVDDLGEGVQFDVLSARHGDRSFSGRMHYYAPERAWVTTDSLPTEFMVAFARGETLRLLNGRGNEVVTFRLDGTAAIIQTMQQVCGF